MRWIFPTSLLVVWLCGAGLLPGHRPLAAREEWRMPAARAGKDRALFFLVNEYDDPLYSDFRNPEGNPIKDGHAIAKLLRGQYGFETEVLENPSLGDIGDKINEYAARYQSNEWDSTGQLMIYFSGHGESNKKKGYFLTPKTRHNDLNFTAFAYDLLRPDLAAIPCKHILVAIDACFSGTFDPRWFNKDKDKNIIKRPGEMTDGQKLVANHELYVTRYFFTSATEVRSPEISNFARKFREGLIAGGGPDGILTSTELFAQIEQANPRPHRGEFEGDDPGSSFLFFSMEYKPDQPKVKTILDDIVAWNEAKAQNTAAAYQAYLKAFPEGEFAEVAQLKISKLMIQFVPGDTTRQFVRWADLVDQQQVAAMKQRLCELGLLDPNCTGDLKTPFHPECRLDGVMGASVRAAIRSYCALAGIEVNDSLILANLSDRLAKTDPNTFLPIEYDDTEGDDPDTRLAKRVLRYLRKQGYWIARGPDMFNIVYVEGMDGDGKVNANTFDQWNDRRLVIQIRPGGKPRLLKNDLCTTEPGAFYTKNPLNPAGAAHLTFGQYKAWVIGLHKGIDPALVQRADLRVVRDSDRNGLRDDKDIIEVSSSNGLNQHPASIDKAPTKIGGYSAGTLAGYNYNDHLAFLDLVKTDSRYVANAGYLFMSTLVEGKALEQ